MPIWVDEGIYTVDFRSAAINASSNNGYANTEYLANQNPSNYVAIDSTTVEVSGRIYGFNIYDISDYPTWQSVFRLYLNSNKLSGFKYTVGTKDQNGNTTSQDSKYTLAIVNGSHPTYKNVGAIGTGYLFRYSLTTIGSMKTDKDFIRIRPTFYHIDSNGQNRKEVDIYYTETFNGKTNHFIKMGSDTDYLNKKSIVTGSTNLAIPREELYQTSVLRNISLNELLSKNSKVYTFTKIMIPENLRTYVGYEHNVPIGINQNEIAMSKQKWYGEYYLPNEIHVVPKGFDVNQYLYDFGGGITYRESFGIKNGYIIVNFEIETVNFFS